MLLHSVRLVTQKAANETTFTQQKKNFSSNNVAKIASFFKVFILRKRKMERCAESCPTEAAQSRQEREGGIIRLTSLGFFLV